MHLNRLKKHGSPLVVVNERHGKSHSAEWSAWKNIIRRCHTTTDKSYPYYGGRGIKVCDRWRDSFINFYQDMGARPDGLTLERIDNNGDYTPENCKWATRYEQGANQRSNHLITHEGKTQTLSEWARERGIKRSTLSGRIHRNKWSVQKSLGFE